MCLSFFPRVLSLPFKMPYNHRPLASLATNIRERTYDLWFPFKPICLNYRPFVNSELVALVNNSSQSSDIIKLSASQVDISWFLKSSLLSRSLYLSFARTHYYEIGFDYRKIAALHSLSNDKLLIFIKVTVGFWASHCYRGSCDSLYSHRPFGCIWLALKMIMKLIR